MKIIFRYVRQLSFETTRKTYGPFGKLMTQNGGKQFRVEGHKLLYIAGFSNPKLQGIAFFFEKSKRIDQNDNITTMPINGDAIGMHFMIS